ncbi:hypothetical protein OB2597_14981 [Pseudooceanicola batsensis HTCC2597]|uniref:Nitrile hydratase beta subunit-like N-terminal domain-containing protein n=1 Tax=Pseudooceanicola batsensis (strain ATCC BAA-863 / DSM 15984 / KCTC 12145 / HTCC2597) TaxID=252305 RepID=A3U2F8_PSEBH|nr:nitrile hydratase accessory protein [Pseudooceanicola batsensis]EAQ01758.1 hypothetical protein OB2597_14981 [Pseudooceanicola batsensis HTCC2597]
MPSERMGIPGLTGPEPPHFFAPWQARAFALTLALHESGAFTWREWAAALSARIGRAEPLPGRSGSEAHAESYYRDWLAALSDLLTHKGHADAATIREMAEVWQRAAGNTPHGTPIRYEAGLDRA